VATTPLIQFHPGAAGLLRRNKVVFYEQFALGPAHQLPALAGFLFVRELPVGLSFELGASNHSQ